MNPLRIVIVAAGAALTGGLLVAGPAEAAPVAPVDVRPERTITGTKAGAKPPWDVHLSTSRRTYAADFHRDRVAVYGAKARGKARPLYTLRGKRTGLFEPRGIARDSRGRLYVANGNKRVLVFGKNARGNVRPIRVLRAGMPVGSVSMTPDNRLMVAGSTAIKIYRRSASGKATPVRQIAGDKAQLNGAYDAKMNVDGRVWVAFGEAELISVFAPGANGNKRVLVFGKNARGNVRPIRVLRAGMHIGSVSMTPDNRLMVAGSTAIKIYRRSASGNATPVRQITGDKAQLNGAYDAKMNVDGRVWVAFGEAELISVFAPGANGNVAPERTITADWAGPGLWEPELLSFDRAGRGYVGLHSGHVYVLGSTATGDATPQLVLSNRRHGHVDGLSVSRTGKVAVTGGNKITLYPRVRALTAPWAVRAVSVSGSPAAKNRVVRWAKPLADGGSAITRYRMAVKQGTTTVKVVRLKASRRSFTLKRSSLPAGTSTVVVQAKNRKGYGPAASVPITVVK